ncbi:MAG TPA: response regulator [Candidatus Kapabacteria bacterium]
MIRILFVEDNQNAARAAKVMLELRGYAVDIATTAAEALQQLERNTYDVLISDLALPDGSGLDIVERASIPAIALSGYIADQDRQEALARGFSAFFAKPFRIEDVIAEIEHIAKK